MAAPTQPLVLQEAKRVAGRGCRERLQEGGCRSRVTGRGYRKGVIGAGLREGVAGRGLQEGGNQKKTSLTKFAVNPMSTIIRVLSFDLMAILGKAGR